MSVGEAIQIARKKAGLTQVELGKKLGVSGSMIGQWENNLRKPKNETLKNIADALNLGFYFDKNGEIYFCEFKDVPHQLFPTPVSGIEFDIEKIYKQLNISLGLSGDEMKRIEKLLDIFDQLNQAGQEKAVERVEELTEIPKYKKEEPSQCDEQQDG